MNNKAKLSRISLLFAALLFWGCGSKDDILPDEQEEWPVGQNVYVAGFENVTKLNSVARLWKNGGVQNLTGNIFRSTGAITDSEVRSRVIRSEAHSVFVSGNDVYVAGYDVIVSGDNWTVNGDEVITNGDEVSTKARLWKNGEMQNLAQGTFSERAMSVFVSDNDVYVLGGESLQPALSTSGRWAYKYWKSGEAKIFAEGNSHEGVKSIFVSNKDIYIAGGYGNQAKLWKNGVEENLPDGTYAKKRGWLLFYFCQHHPLFF
jgi:hypothetical protein